MKLKEKVAFAVLGLAIFFVVGGVACTYSSTGVVNPVFAVSLGVLVVFTAGAVACTHNCSKIEKQKATQTAQKTSAKA